MIWNVLTKYLISCVQEKGKGIEIPHFAIFGPIIDKFSLLKNPLDKGPANDSFAQRNTLNPVIAILSEDFVDSTEA